VYLGKDGAFMMKGGTVSGHAIYGGGVISYGTFTMNGGEISGCTNPSWTSAKYSGGAGVYVSPYGGTFTMTDGTISGNTATGNGGGVYINGSYGTFNMTSGTIYGSTESGNDASDKPLKNIAKASGDGRGDAYYISGGQYSNDTTNNYSPSSP
jgi:parallel beta-helix repeat protein